MIYVYTYVYTFIYIYMYLFISASVCVPVRMWSLPLSLQLSLSLSMYTFMCANMCVPLRMWVSGLSSALSENLKLLVSGKLSMHDHNVHKKQERDTLNGPNRCAWCTCSICSKAWITRLLRGASCIQRSKVCIGTFRIFIACPACFWIPA